MLLAQAFAEYLGFVECVSAAKPQCRMGRAKRNALWSYTVSDQGQVNGLLNSSPIAFGTNSAHWKNDVNESGDEMEMTP
jgi:hypothetical protein